MATPCPGNVSLLLDLALASARGGDDAEARRLEAHADEHWMEAFRSYFEPAKIQLALARNDLAELRRLVDSLDLGVVGRRSGFDRAAALFDALVALGDREWIESEAPQWVRDATYVEPFALRALGVARDDSRLLNEASARFEAMGLEWHSGETRKLVSQN